MADDFGGAVVHDVETTNAAYLLSMWTSFDPAEIPASCITSPTLEKCTIPGPTDVPALKIVLAGSSNESAIDDDEDWESGEEEESSRSMAKDVNFKRVKFRTCRRRSPIIPKRKAMKSGTPLAGPICPINKVPRSALQPINVTVTGMQSQAPPLSPHTTRRNMLATELPKSLRGEILRERCQNTRTANAVFKRRHTSCDVVNLKQYPEKPFMKKDKDVDTNSSSWIEYLDNPFKHQVDAW
ncbi:hypothetical protein VTG60DRAFT_3334 [Thermothelomyces hinnuleus]